MGACTIAIPQGTFAPGGGGTEVQTFTKQRRAGAFAGADGNRYSEAPVEIQSAMRLRSSGQKANEELRGIGPLPGVGGALRSAL